MNLASARETTITLSAILVSAVCVLEIPGPATFLRERPTPFDSGPVASVGPAYDLLRAAQDVVPVGATVLVRQEPPGFPGDIYFYRGAVALLPGREVVQSPALTDELAGIEARVRYLILLGKADKSPRFVKVRETPAGSIWADRSPR